MKKQSISSTSFLSAMALALIMGGTSIASAQTYGMITVGPGMPVQNLTGMSGGPGQEMAASMYGSTCRGYISGTPQHILNVTQAGMVNIAVTSTDSGDTTLVVIGPGGTFCNDDSNGFNPGLNQMLAPGAYSVWVGSYGSGTTHPYNIQMSAAGGIPGQMGQVAGPHGLSTSNIPEDPMGQITLAAGFMPDPQVRSGIAGGPVAAGSIPNNYGGNCRGYTQAQPDHVMVTTTPFSYMRVHVQANGDPTLIIQDPNGSFWCNDDENGLLPAISGPWDAGTWRIWVGSYSSTTQIPYSIMFTEYQQ